MQDGHLSQVSVTKRRIQLAKVTATIRTCSYCAESLQIQLERDKINKMLKDNVAEPTTIEWVSPFTNAPKKDGSLRFRVDYWKPNVVTLRKS